jgi:hypothetical protein
VEADEEKTPVYAEQEKEKEKSMNPEDEKTLVDVESP